MDEHRDWWRVAGIVAVVLIGGVLVAYVLLEWAAR